MPQPCKVTPTLDYRPQKPVIRIYPRAVYPAPAECCPVCLERNIRMLGPGGDPARHCNICGNEW